MLIFLKIWVDIFGISFHSALRATRVLVDLILGKKYSDSGIKFEKIEWTVLNLKYSTSTYIFGNKYNLNHNLESCEYSNLRIK